MDADLTRAIAFENAMRDRMADGKERFRWGTALFNSRAPAIYDLNFLRVEGTDGPDAIQLAAVADRLMEPRGLKHRKVAVDDEAAGQALAPGFTELGWEVHRHVFMAHRGEADPPSKIPVDEIEPALHTATRSEFNRREPHFQGDEQALLQMRDVARLTFEATDKRCFAVYAGDRIASICELYSDGSTAQIEDVRTLDEYRGQGLATAVVLRALHEALAWKHDLVFLVADDEDWPKLLYKKLGFVELGRTYQFLKRS